MRSIGIFQEANHSCEIAGAYAGAVTEFLGTWPVALRLELSRWSLCWLSTHSSTCSGVNFSTVKVSPTNVPNEWMKRAYCSWAEAARLSLHQAKNSYKIVTKVVLSLTG